MSDGRIRIGFTSTLKKLRIGIRIYGVDFYGTKGGPVDPESLGVNSIEK